MALYDYWSSFFVRIFALRLESFTHIYVSVHYIAKPVKAILVYHFMPTTYYYCVYSLSVTCYLLLIIFLGFSELALLPPTSTALPRTMPSLGKHEKQLRRSLVLRSRVVVPLKNEDGHWRGLERRPEDWSRTEEDLWLGPYSIRKRQKFVSDVSKLSRYAS